MGTTSSKKKNKQTANTKYLTSLKTGRLFLSKSKPPLKSFPIKLLEPDFKVLTALDLSGNLLTSIPGGIKHLVNLKTLNLANNKLESLPMEMNQLVALRTLSLEGNFLSSVKAVLPPNQLHTLNLSHNRLVGNIGHPMVGLPKSVVVVDLSFNRITGFSETFGFETLHMLEDLNVDNNEIQMISPAIGFAAKLGCLRARNNRLQILPKELFLGCQNLSRLHLEGNPMTKEDLLAIEGVDAFLEKRQDRISKGIQGGLNHQDLSICGLD